MTTTTMSSALVRPDSALPASYTGASVGLIEGLNTWVTSRLFGLGERFLVETIVDAYKNVASPHDATLAVDRLLLEWPVRRWLINFQMALEDQAREASRLGLQAPFPQHKWLPDDIHEQLRLLQDCVTAFNKWTRGKSHGLSPILVLLLQHAESPKFNQAFDDSRIPASVRLAYYAHRSIAVHGPALHLQHEGKLPATIVGPVTDVLRSNVQRALRLALGMPGVDDVREAAIAKGVRVEILDLDAESKAWNQYLRGAHPVG